MVIGEQAPSPRSGTRPGASCPRSATTGPGSPSTRSTRRRRRARPACAPRPQTTSNACCLRAPRRTSSSSARTRSLATLTASAGGRSLRSRRGARGCGSRTTSSCSRPRPRPGRRLPCSCSRSGSTRPCAGGATGCAASATCAGSCSQRRRPSRCSYGARTRPRSRSTMPSACAGPSNTGASCSEAPPPARGRDLGAALGRPASTPRYLVPEDVRDERAPRARRAAHSAARVDRAGQEVVCLVSGGADSTCLFHVLSELGHRVSALHVDHGLRGAESDEDARWCAERFDARGRAGSRALRDRSRAPRRALLVPRRRSARDRAHALRPGRDGPLPPRLERPANGDQGPPRGRGRAAAAVPLARRDRGLLP